MNAIIRRGIKASPLFFMEVMIFLSAWIFILSRDFNDEHKAHSSHLLMKPETLEHISLGFKMLMADGIWLRLIQELDYRENDDVSQGWVYHMLDAVTVIDPRYKVAYVSGTTVLSVLVHDVEGARLMYERGLEQFPTFWPLIYRAGYHYFYEVKDCKRAANLFQLAALHGAPPWLNSLAAKLYVRTGQIELARTLLIDSIKKFEGTEIESELRQRLSKLDEMEKDPTQRGKLPIQCNTK
jgi:hypothetical protein